MSMTNENHIATIRTSDENAKEYFSVFFTNNEQAYWHFITDDIIKNGFTSDYSDKHVVFSIKDFFEGNIDKLCYPVYIKYTWFSIANNVEKSEIRSDINSIIWPNFEEQYCLNN
jgi:hypothetical protein